MYVQSMGWKDPLEVGMAAHSSILAWKIPWAEEPGRPQSIGSQSIRHSWVTWHTCRETMSTSPLRSISFVITEFKSLSISHCYIKKEVCCQYLSYLSGKSQCIYLMNQFKNSEMMCTFNTKVPSHPHF